MISTKSFMVSGLSRGRVFSSPNLLHSITVYRRHPPTMAADFLAKYGIDLQSTLTNAQYGSPPSTLSHIPSLQPLSQILGVRLAHRNPSILWDISLSRNESEPGTIRVTAIEPHKDTTLAPSDPRILDARECFLAPSLCHPHIHLDKSMLLSSPHHESHTITKGTFQEALSLTAASKAKFTPEDLHQRGTWLISESVAAGVTHMRAFVEVDTQVNFMCLDAGLQLKKEWKDICNIQLCVFAQEPVFSGEHGEANRRLMEEAVKRTGVQCVGSTPYVEASREIEIQNIYWLVQLAYQENLHVDFHTDYNTDADREPAVWHILPILKTIGLASGSTAVLGHCTRLTLFDDEEWQRLKVECEGLRVGFVGLPTSDLYMMGKTLDVLAMEDRGLRVALGVNNTGNAFTPQGCVDPLGLAALGVAVYRRGTRWDAERLYDCISERAKDVIGCGDGICNESEEIEISVGTKADFVLFGRVGREGGYRSRRSVQEVVCDAGWERTTVKNGFRVVMG